MVAILYGTNTTKKRKGLQEVKRMGKGRYRFKDDCVHLTLERTKRDAKLIEKRIKKEEKINRSQKPYMKIKLSSYNCNG